MILVVPRSTPVLAPGQDQDQDQDLGQDLGPDLHLSIKCSHRWHTLLVDPTIPSVRLMGRLPYSADHYNRKMLDRHSKKVRARYNRCRSALVSAAAIRSNQDLGQLPERFPRDSSRY